MRCNASTLKRGCPARAWPGKVSFFRLISETMPCFNTLHALTTSMPTNTPQRLLIFQIRDFVPAKFELDAARLGNKAVGSAAGVKTTHRNITLSHAKCL